MTCIIKSKKAKAELRKELQDGVDARVKQLGVGNSYAPYVAIREVTEEALEARLAAKMDEIRTAILVKNKIDPRFTDAPTPLEGALSILDTSPKGYNRLGNITDRSYLLRARAMAAGGEALATWRAKLTSAIVRAPWKDAVGSEKNAALARAILGLPTDDPEAKTVAQGIKRFSDFLIEMRRNAGGSMGKLDGYVPHNWNREKLLAVKKDDFVKEAMGDIPGTNKPILDRSRMRDGVTDELLDEEQLRHALEWSYETISLDGLNKLKPGAFKGKPRLSRAREASRFLHFTPEGYLHMLGKYMDDNIYETFMRWGADMADEIAQLEHLGPNPRHMESYIADTLKKLTPGQKGIDDANAFLRAADIRANRINQPVNSTTTKAFGVVRSVAAMNHLSSAAIAGLAGDPFTVSLRSMLHKGNFTKFLVDYVDFMRNSDTQSHHLIEHLDVWETMVWNMAHFARSAADQAWVETKVGRMTSNVLEKSGLYHFFDAGRHGVQNSMERSWLRYKATEFDSLPSAMKRTFSNYGVDAKHWDIIRNHGLMKVERSFGDVEQVNYRALYEAGDTSWEQAADRFKEMVIGETRQAVISDSLRGKMVLPQSDARAGTFWGETMRMLGSYAKWPATAMYSMFAPLGRSDIPLITKGAYMGWLAVGGFLFGALSLQANQVLTGKEPLRMLDEDGNLDWRFLASAWLKSGLASYFGDTAIRVFGLQDVYALEDWTPYKMADVMDVVPPLGMMKDMAVNTVVKPVMEGIKEGDAEAGFKKFMGDGLARELMTDLGGVLGLKVWYAKLAYERLVIDNLNRVLDPDGYAERVRQASNRMEEKDQGWLWEPPQ